MATRNRLPALIFQRTWCAMQQQKTVTVAIVGAPNAGKSTLLNHLCGQKISIVSPKSQTTRIVINGIMMENDTQVVFYDTPGIFNAKEKYEAGLVTRAKEVLDSCDLTLFLFDSSRRFYDLEKQIAEELSRAVNRVSLVLNKIDMCRKEKLLGLAGELNSIAKFEQTFMISAETGEGVDTLKKYILDNATESPWLFPEDEASSLPLRTMAEEVTREKLFYALHDEIPYAVKVETEKWSEENGKAVIHQSILVEKESQKKIVIGRGGEVLKSVGMAARKDIQKLTGKPAQLFLHVKVDERWKEKELVKKR